MMSFFYLVVDETLRNVVSRGPSNQKMRKCNHFKEHICLERGWLKPPLFFFKWLIWCAFELNQLFLFHHLFLDF